ncbi:hypothetical protein H6785_02750 [Candidatus Nomurabacteria bacterium]|nr:hypothetical protein [Candidatus Nomurabacteria bacterium]
MKHTTKIIVGVVSLLVVGTLYVLLTNKEPVIEIVPETIVEPEVVPEIPTTTHSVIGKSVQGREIETYTIGTGDTDLLFVGGMHGGYEWNSILLAYEMIDYFENNLSVIPDNVKVHIIPNLNPDGLFLATGLERRFEATDISSNAMHTSGAGRFNANDVDLNRNFDCKWAPTSSWRGATVSAGTSAFSEPEAQALRDYVATISPEAVVFWHSQANNVYASECENGVLPETLTLMNAYSVAGNYGAVPVFDAYPITGDAEGWLASIGIPAVTVELEGRTSIEWTRNLAGVNAVLNQYGK